METSDQNGNEEENGQNGAEQELMVGEDSQDNGTDGGKIDASKGEEDAGCVWMDSGAWMQSVCAKLVRDDLTVDSCLQ